MNLHLELEKKSWFSVEALNVMKSLYFLIILNYSLIVVDSKFISMKHVEL